MTRKTEDIPLQRRVSEKEPKTPIIISASRSTDIPAFYAEWFINRLQEGHVKWKNPFNGVHVKVSFEKVRLIVFWTKNPKPIMSRLEYLDEKSLNYYFQFTLNDYDEENFEPHVQNVQERIEIFKKLSEKIGKTKVIWRFDPLILTEKIGVDELLRKLENIGNQLKNHTNKLVFSFADITSYKKVQINLRRGSITCKEFNEKAMNEFAAGLQGLNKNWHFELATCAEKIPLQEYGISHNKCIDDDLIIKLFPKDKELMNFLGVEIAQNFLNQNEIIKKKRNNKDKGQRKYCGCIISKDIGEYNTCAHLCEYCYANASKETALANYKRSKCDMHTESIKGR